MTSVQIKGVPEETHAVLRQTERLELINPYRNICLACWCWKRARRNLDEVLDRAGRPKGRSNQLPSSRPAGTGRSCAVGGRTGLTSLVTGLLMLSGLFLSPLAQMIGEGYKSSSGLTLYPTVAPALIVVGAFMMRNVGRIAWDDPLEYIPAFITIAFIPFTFEYHGRHRLRLHFLCDPQCSRRTLPKAPLADGALYGVVCDSVYRDVANCSGL